MLFEKGLTANFELMFIFSLHYKFNKALDNFGYKKDQIFYKNLIFLPLIFVVIFSRKTNS